MYHRPTASAPRNSLSNHSNTQVMQWLQKVLCVATVQYMFPKQDILYEYTAPCNMKQCVHRGKPQLGNSVYARFNFTFPLAVDLDGTYYEISTLVSKKQLVATQPFGDLDGGW